MHRTDLLAAVPEIPRRPGAGQGGRGGAGRKEIQLHPRPALPLGKLGRAELDTLLGLAERGIAQLIAEQKSVLAERR